MPVSAPSDKRFRRAQVRPAQRALWRRKRRALLGGAVLVVLIVVTAYGVAVQALTARSLAIDRISVTGNARMSTREVHQVLSELRGANMLTADLDAARRKLLATRWVAQVEMRRLFPAGIAVTLVERDAVAIGRIGSELFLIDGQGEVIDRLGPRYAEFDLPIVNGLGATAGGGSLVDERRAAVAARLLASLQGRPDLARLVSEVDVTDPRDVIVVLRDDTVMVRVGAEQFAERLQSYVELAPRLRDSVGGIDYVDMRYGNLVFVGPQRAARGESSLR